MMSSLAKVVSLRVSAIVHATEDTDRVTQAIRNISQIDGSAEQVSNRAKGHHGNQITTMAMIVKSPKAADYGLRYIWSRLPMVDKNSVFSSLTSRVDASGTLFLRIDKQEAFKGIVRLQDSDPIKVGVLFRTSGSKPDFVVNEIQKFLIEISDGLATFQ